MSRRVRPLKSHGGPVFLVPVTRYRGRVSLAAAIRDAVRRATTAAFTAARLPSVATTCRFFKKGTNGLLLYTLAHSPDPFTSPGIYAPRARVCVRGIYKYRLKRRNAVGPYERRERAALASREHSRKRQGSEACCFSEAPPRGGSVRVAASVSRRRVRASVFV